jgi:AraC-like DNA-binding protein
LIHDSTDLTFTESTGEGVMRHALGGGRPAGRQPAEFLAAVWLRLGRLVTGGEWTPTLVCFAHDAPSSITEHTRLFGPTVRFASGRTAMHFSNEVLDVANPRANPDLGVVLDRYAQLELGKVANRATLSARVAAWVAGSLSSGVPGADAAARAMNLSVRSLHRGLQSERTTYRDVVARVRYERATMLLRDPSHSMSEAAFLLGFSELSSFYRAFKRWSGTTPAEFRARE